MSRAMRYVHFDDGNFGTCSIAISFIATGTHFFEFKQNRDVARFLTRCNRAGVTCNCGNRGWIYKSKKIYVIINY